jgi:hypothetical protein
MSLDQNPNCVHQMSGGDHYGHSGGVGERAPKDVRIEPLNSSAR